MKLIGTVSKEKNEKGYYTMEIRGLTIPMKGVAAGHAGQRTCVRGKPAWSADKGSYFRVLYAGPTDKPDSNAVEVEGTITRIYPECKNARNRRSVCVILQQSRDKHSTVLVTALSSHIEDLQPDTLEVGQRLRVRGYISYHGKGLHILYAKTLRLEV